MPKPGPRTVRAYSEEFKATAVCLSHLPGRSCPLDIHEVVPPYTSAGFALTGCRSSAMIA